MREAIALARWDLRTIMVSEHISDCRGNPLAIDSAAKTAFSEQTRLPYAGRQADLATKS